MTSLFRAWTTCKPQQSLNCTTTSSSHEEPDTVLQVGPARFAAHSRLLITHSGYFKSLLQTNNNNEVVFVANVTPQQFWPLFAYIYTGYLDLNPENIYQVLLATHLLHMPRALELCRNYLAQGGAAPLPPPPTVTVVKPIPSRKLPPFLTQTAFRPMFPPLESSLLSGSFASHPFFKTHLEAQSSLQTATQSTSPKNEEKCAPQSDSDDSVDILGMESCTPPPIISTIQKKLKIRPIKKPTATVTVENATVESISKIKNPPDDKIVVDVACCDGPVQFHRVLNDAYKSGSGSTMEAVDCSDSDDDSYVEIEEDTQPYDNSNAFSKSLQKQLNEDIRKRDENNGEALPETIYTCVYCDHTFKSQYCYQKHARRHINPVTIDAVNQEVDTVLICDKSKKTQVRREVRLLDMNVQYYPCKSCGSKFPSYYFVHKHRKMCHADELDGAELRGQPEKKKMKTKDTEQEKLIKSSSEAIETGK